MKKILSCFVLLVLMCFAVSAQAPKGTDEPGTGLENPDIKEGQETGQGLQPDQAAANATGQAGQPGTVRAEEKVQHRVRQGNYVTVQGQNVQIQEESNNRLRIRVQNVTAHTAQEVLQEKVQNRSRLMLSLSNGKNASIKVMPDTASQRAIQRLQLKVCSEENNCTIELKEVGQGEQMRAAYQVQAEKQVRMLGIWRTRMQVQAQVDAESGEVIRSQKPWWAFLAAE
ncbi:hypothetical protein GF351_01175 [Candidatus Woesearchaeota archaeon]|nr:hypothetical protein [Candidatus Woesearchaeota archaeon]